MAGKDDKATEEAKKGSSKSSSTQDASRKNSSASSSDSASAGNVIVVCRFRPLNQNELNHGGSTVCADFHPNKKSVTIETKGDGTVNKNEFTFDRVFDTNTAQIDVYNHAAKPIIESVMEGFNGTVFAYGQTGSGKTFTMQGPDIEDLEMQGIVPRMVRTVFNRIDNSSENIEFTVKVSMMEIYMEKIRDLLDPTKSNMQIKVDKNKGIYVADLTERYIGSDLDVYDIMRIGNDNRKVASTSMNDQSSRSHSIFVMTIHQTNLDDQTCKTGVLYLVDLAGSEKVGKTGAKGHTLDEAKGINKSLSTLGKVINSLTDGKSKHIPYRESKLTRILSESLGGNARTALIITCSPSVYNDMETISTLRFGTAARNIKNKPKINKELTVAEMKKLLAKSEKIIQVRNYRIEVLSKIMVEKGVDLPPDEFENMKIDNKKIILDDEEEKLLPDDEGEGEDKPRKSDDEEEIEEEKQPDNEFQEQIKRLREKLNIETDKYCNLSDEFNVVQNKYTAAQEKNDALLAKNQKLLEDMDEKNDLIETLEEKVKVLEEELKSMSESHEKLSNKVNKYEEMGGVYFPGMDDDENASPHKKNPQSALHKEIMKISQQLKAKERLLKKIEELPDLDDKIKKIMNLEIDSSKEVSKEEEKGEDEFLKTSLLNIKADLSSFKDKNISLFLTEDDTNKLIKSQIELRDTLEHTEKQRKSLEEKNESLASELKNAVEVDNPNIQAITKRLADDEIAKAEYRWAEEKMQILRDLENRVSKVVNLEIALDESEERFRRLENSINQGDMPLRKKISKLENQAEQLTIMYHQVVSEKSVLKVDYQVAEKKLKRKDDKITALEKTLNKLREQNNALKKILTGLKNLKMRASDDNRVLESNNVTGIPSSGRIVKPLRGGRKDQTPRGLSGTQSQMIQDLLRDPNSNSASKKI